MTQHPHRRIKGIGFRGITTPALFTTTIVNKASKTCKLLSTYLDPLPVVSVQECSKPYQLILGIYDFISLVFPLMCFCLTVNIFWIIRQFIFTENTHQQYLRFIESCYFIIVRVLQVLSFLLKAIFIQTSRKVVFNGISGFDLDDPK